MPSVIINEFRRDGQFTNTEYIELLLTEDFTANQLQNLYFGDSTGTTAAKFSAYQFTNLASIAPVFKAGTLIAVGGTTPIPLQDLFYNPIAGGNNNDWNIQLQFNNSNITTVTGGGDFAASDVVWVDNSNTLTSSIDSIAWATSPGAFAQAAKVRISAPSNQNNVEFIGDGTGVDVTSNYSINSPGSIALPNSGNNTTYINSLRNSSQPNLALSLAISPSTFSEAAGNNAATATVTRNGSTTNALTVTLSSSDTTEASVANTVTILAGETNASFAVNAVDDSLVDGSQNVAIAASATSYINATANVTVTDNDIAPAVRIYDIQGAAQRSPLEGQTVNVPGIVTVVRSNGFYLQDPNPDSDDRTSEGIFIFTSSAPTVVVGDSILVSGTVSEFRPGGANSTNLTTTQISSPSVTKLSSGNALPIATILGNGGRTIPTTVIENDATGNVETSNTFDPAEDGIDFYESLEGMRVQVNNAVAVGPTNDFGEIPVLADNGVNAGIRTPRGGIIIQPGDFNPERIFIDDAIVANEPQVNVGDTFNGAIVGVLDYSFGNFKLLNTSPLPTPTSGGLQREVTNLTGSTDKLTVATFNVENLDPGDAGTKFNNIAGLIVNNLKTPDIISLEEVQDNNGATNDSVVDADVTYQTLIDAIASAGGPTYEFRQINPVDDQDGGEPGGNIRVGFLFNPSRVSFVDRPGGGSTTATTINNVGNDPQLSSSPGRIDPTNTAFNSSRKPLAGEFLFNDEKVFIVANHFNSKGGDQPLFGNSQPPILSSEAQRLQQAEIVNNFVSNILAVDSNANVIVMGDLNDFQFSNPLTTLKGDDLSNLTDTLPVNEQYSYVFEGNSQQLDHILVSNNLRTNAAGELDIVHVNSEFVDQISDHDPLVARFSLPPINVINGTSGRDTLIGTNNRDRIIGGLGGDILTGGGGKDEFVYTNIREGGDRITDFTPGSDKIVFTQLLDSLVAGGYNGLNAIADGYVQLIQGSTANNTTLQIDQDGPVGSGIFRPFIQLDNVSVTAMNNVNNFVF